MVGDPRPVEVGTADAGAAETAQGVRQGVVDGTVVGRHLRQCGPGELAGRDDGRAQMLRQRPDQGDAQFFAHTGDKPAGVGVVQPGEQRQWHSHGDAVGGVTRPENVLQLVLHRPLAPGVGELPGLGGLTVRADQGVLGEVQQVRGTVAGLLPPGVEVPGRDDLRGDPRIVEVIEGVVVHDDVAPAGLLLQLGGVLQKLTVVGEEPVAGVPVSLDQRGADEGLARRGRIDLRQGHRAVSDDRQSQQQGLLVDHGGAALRRPVRFRIGVLHHVRGDLLDPLRGQRGDCPGEDP